MPILALTRQPATYLPAPAAMLSPTTLTFSVLALVLAERPLRTGIWFYLGAFTVTIAIGVLVVGLDLTVLNLALPTVATDLHASTSDQQWFLAAYSLVVAAAMLPA